MAALPVRLTSAGPVRTKGTNMKKHEYTRDAFPIPGYAIFLPLAQTQLRALLDGRCTFPTHIPDYRWAIETLHARLGIPLVVLKRCLRERQCGTMHHGWDCDEKRAGVLPDCQPLS
jgi:hypothetical protein